MPPQDPAREPSPPPPPPPPPDVDESLITYIERGKAPDRESKVISPDEHK